MEFVEGMLQKNPRVTVYYLSEEVENWKTPFQCIC